MWRKARCGFATTTQLNGNGNGARLWGRMYKHTVYHTPASLLSTRTYLTFYVMIRHISLVTSNNSNEMNWKERKKSLNTFFRNRRFSLPSPFTEKTRSLNKSLRCWRKQKAAESFFFYFKRASSPLDCFFHSQCHSNGIIRWNETKQKSQDTTMKHCSHDLFWCCYDIQAVNSECEKLWNVDS